MGLARPSTPFCRSSGYAAKTWGRDKPGQGELRLSRWHQYFARRAAKFSPDSPAGERGERVKSATFCEKFSAGVSEKLSLDFPSPRTALRTAGEGRPSRQPLVVEG